MVEVTFLTLVCVGVGVDVCVCARARCVCLCVCVCVVRLLACLPAKEHLSIIVRALWDTGRKVVSIEFVTLLLQVFVQKYYYTSKQITIKWTS